MFSLKNKKHYSLFFNKTGSVLNEEFHRIKSNIEFASFKGNYHSIAITSPQEKEGKTTIISHLALTLAQEGKKVLLIDANFAKPEISKQFDIPLEVGLSNVLIGQKKLRDVINVSEYKGLDVLAAGPLSKQLVELVQSADMDHVLNEAKKKYDYILVDTQAVLISQVARVITNKCDATVLVTRKSKTDVSLINEAKKLLESYNVNLIGLIFNDKNYSLLNLFKSQKSYSLANLFRRS
ncbi:CpsD/CapB family tyrosine-protein kinase [Salipaludibacillus agaradhaerens]|uniref:CpsD/CapB family tyrosine-protein kinase n=1 Tax=Salipaludibacillus agaradhaerens TaxID=76935 RepID=UPI001474FF94|nr:CpsD/CapB family tyrosine-protein kinase [Salipaludibacillus agaradhaerens]